MDIQKQLIAVNNIGYNNISKFLLNKDIISKNSTTYELMSAIDFIQVANYEQLSYKVKFYFNNNLLIEKTGNNNYHINAPHIFYQDNDNISWQQEYEWIDRDTQKVINFPLTLTKDYILDNGKCTNEQSMIFTITIKTDTSFSDVKYVKIGQQLQLSEELILQYDWFDEENNKIIFPYTPTKNTTLIGKKNNIYLGFYKQSFNNIHGYNPYVYFNFASFSPSHFIGTVAVVNIGSFSMATTKIVADEKNITHIQDDIYQFSCNVLGSFYSNFTFLIDLRDLSVIHFWATGTYHKIKDALLLSTNMTEIITIPQGQIIVNEPQLKQESLNLIKEVMPNG